MSALLSSIPSPSFNSIDIGPLSLNIYGLAIALGVVAAVWLFGKRLEERGAGTADDASSISIWAVLAGVIGSRIYHVITDWDRFTDDYSAIPKLWEGGLGIPGGLALGIPTGLILAKRKGISMPMAATCAAPAIALAQAIGRWGNYFNQELYGRATDLPWALQIDDAHLPSSGAFASGTTFHPTFLYESLWSLAVCGGLLWVDRKYRPGLGQLMPMYLIAYGIGRFWVEGLRIDRADIVGGMRWNQWVALAMVVGGGAILMAMQNSPISGEIPADVHDSPGESDPADDVDEPNGESGLDEIDDGFADDDVDDARERLDRLEEQDLVDLGDPDESS